LEPSGKKKKKSTAVVIFHEHFAQEIPSRIDKNLVVKRNVRNMIIFFFKGLADVISFYLFFFFYYSIEKIMKMLIEADGSFFKKKKRSWMAGLAAPRSFSLTSFFFQLVVVFGVERFASSLTGSDSIALRF
jgi:hypothetical protein